MTTKANITKLRRGRYYEPRIKTETMHLLITGVTMKGDNLPTHEYMGTTTKTLNELIDYYVETFPTAVRVILDVAIPHPIQRVQLPQL